MGKLEGRAETPSTLPGFGPCSKNLISICCMNINWASEANPTLGCSIEISGDIYCRYVGVCWSMSVVCQINCVGGITWPTCKLKVFFGRLNQ